eukprot:ANDGO_07329.mRNA.1 hypothetical protein GUITHDRAFT_150959
MYRAQPIQSRVLHERWQEKQYKAHRAKLSTVKPTVDNKSPPRFRHMQLNLKRAQVEEERYATIERDNRRLLQRMTDIMTLEKSDSETGMTKPGMAGDGGLHRAARRRELERITAENQWILDRIQHTRPDYSRVQLEEEFRRNEALAKSIAQLPFVLATSPNSASGSKHRAVSTGRTSSRRRQPSAKRGNSREAEDAHYLYQEHPHSAPHDEDSYLRESDQIRRDVQQRAVAAE